MRVWNSRVISTQISSICVFCDDIKYRKKNYLNFSYDHLSMHFIFHHFLHYFSLLFCFQGTDSVSGKICIVPYSLLEKLVDNGRIRPEQVSESEVTLGYVTY